MNLKKLAASAVLAAGAIAAVVIGGPVTAAPTHMVITTYYSDASLSDYVGETVRSCDGSRGSWGITNTAYTSVEYISCY